MWDHNPRNPYWRVLMARVPQDTGEERLIPEDELLDGLTRRGRTNAALDSARAWSRLRATSCASALRPRAERAVERTPLARRLCAHNVILAEPTGPRTP